MKTIEVKIAKLTKNGAVYLFADRNDVLAKSNLWSSRFHGSNEDLSVYAHKLKPINKHWVSDLPVLNDGFSEYSETAFGTAQINAAGEVLSVTPELTVGGALVLF